MALRPGKSEERTGLAGRLWDEYLKLPGVTEENVQPASLDALAKGLIDYINDTSVIGNWTDITLGITVQAPSDGFIVCNITAGSSESGNVVVSTGDDEDSLTSKASASASASAPDSCCCPIKKGEYYRVTHTSSGSTCSARWRGLLTE